VLENRTRFERSPGGAPVDISLTGEILCPSDILLEVDKAYDVRVVRAHEEIRGVLYRYTARIPGRGNIVRYDNMHADTPDEFHRHVYDLRTRSQTSLTPMTREDFPVLTEVLDEVQRLAEEAGLR
jgi:hypothetical protein